MITINRLVALPQKEKRLFARRQKQRLDNISTEITSSFLLGKTKWIDILCFSLQIFFLFLPSVLATTTYHITIVVVLFYILTSHRRIKNNTAIAMADLPSDKVDEAKQVFDVFDKKYEVRCEFVICSRNRRLNKHFSLIIKGQSRFILHWRHASLTRSLPDTSRM